MISFQNFHVSGNAQQSYLVLRETGGTCLAHEFLFLFLSFSMHVEKLSLMCYCAYFGQDNAHHC